MPTLQKQIHHALNTRQVLHQLYKIDWFGEGFLSCTPLFAISIVSGITLTSLFELGFWLTHGRVGFAFIWLVVGALAATPLWF